MIPPIRCTYCKGTLLLDDDDGLICMLCARPHPPRAPLALPVRPGHRPAVPGGREAARLLKLVPLFELR